MGSPMAVESSDMALVTCEMAYSAWVENAP
jgi:hypothetical protein